MKSELQVYSGQITDLTEKENRIAFRSGPVRAVRFALSLSPLGSLVTLQT